MSEYEKLELSVAAAVITDGYIALSDKDIEQLQARLKPRSKKLEKVLCCTSVSIIKE